MKSSALTLTLLLSSPLVATAGTLTGPIVFTDDSTSGVDPAKFYTHTIDCGTGAGAGRPVVNGLTFHPVVNAAQIGSYGYSTNQPNNGAANDNTSVDLAGGMHALLRDIQWNQNNPGTLQLTGLEPGALYELRLYQRAWSSPANRTHNIIFDDGSGAPSTVNFNPDATATAQYFSYAYTAPESGVLAVSWTSDGAAGTLHLYGLTNELVDDGTWMHAKVASDNHYAIYLARADGSSMRYVGRDTFGDWRDAAKLVIDPLPGDHLYLMTWDNPGAVGDPQMLIGEFETPEGTFVTNGVDWEVVEGPPGSNPGGELSPTSLPGLSEIQTVITGATWLAPGAVAPNTTAPWGPNAEFAGHWVGSTAEFVWGDTFDNISSSNTNESYYLFRTNVAVRTGLAFELDNLVFSSGVSQGDGVADFEAYSSDDDDVISYAFIAGEGDDDNGKFQLAGANGGNLQAGTHDFGSDADGTTYSIRVQATGTETGSFEATFVLTLQGDSDGDMLPDTWELAFSADLTELSGLGDADFDNDGLTDLEEFGLNPSGNPDGVDPVNFDSDDDELLDGDEIALGTDPLDPDSDDDGMLDGSEDAQGTDPNNKDTDGDGWRDGLELVAGSDPTDPTSVVSFEPGYSIGGLLTDDCSTGISPLANYTHAISPGGAVTINGVDLVDMDPTFEPAGIVWEASGGKSEIPTIRNNAWMPALGGVTGPGMLRLLGGFTYSGGGANAGSTQRFTLSGLAAGVTYDLRLYIRPWAVAGVRFIDLTFTNGAEVVAPTPEGGFPEDNSQAVLMNGGSDHQAYFMNFRYTAQGETLIIDANVPATAPPNNGSFHLYGLTNEVAADAGAFEFVITSVSRDSASGEVTITFNSQPGVDYAVDFCTTLNPEGQPGGWQELTDSVESMGASTSFTDDIAAPANPPVLLYRVKPLP